ncbi:hypothetical protein ACHAQA_005336 [Verticillium albo-atrum]
MATYIQNTGDVLKDTEGVDDQHTSLSPVGSAVSVHGSVVEPEINSGSITLSGPVASHDEQPAIASHNDELIQSDTETAKTFGRLKDPYEGSAFFDHRTYLTNMMLVVDFIIDSKPKKGLSTRNRPIRDRPKVDVTNNTAVWLTGLPPDTTVASLLGAIALVGPIGKISATFVDGPDAEKGHPNAAATIIFWDRQGALRLKDAITKGRLTFPSSQVVDDRPRILRFQWNRVKSAPRQDSVSSRVLVITGAHAIVNEAVLSEFFRSKLPYDTEFVHTTHVAKRSTTLTWGFGSFPGQSLAAIIVLRQEFGKYVQTRFGCDPCA